MSLTEWANSNLSSRGEFAVLNIERAAFASANDETVFKKTATSNARMEDYQQGIYNLNALDNAQKFCFETGTPLKVTEGLFPLFGYKNNQGFAKAMQMNGWAVERPRVKSLDFSPNPDRPGFEIATAKISKKFRAAKVGMSFILRNIFDGPGGNSDAFRMNGSHMLTSIDNDNLIITFDVKSITGAPLISPGSNLQTYRIDHAGRRIYQALNGMKYAEIHVPTSQFAFQGGFDDRREEATNTVTKGASLKLNLLGFADHINPAETVTTPGFKPDKKLHFTSHFTKFDMEGCSSSGGQSRTWRGALITDAMFNQSGLGGVSKYGFCDRGLDLQVLSRMVITRTIGGSFGKYAVIAGDSCNVFSHSSIWANSLIAMRGTNGANIHAPATRMLGNLTAMNISNGAKGYVQSTTDIENGHTGFRFKGNGEIYGVPNFKNMEHESENTPDQTTENGTWFTGAELIDPDDE